MKIFPAIDIKDKKCVRLVKGDFDNKTEYDMSPVNQAGKYKDHGFRNLHIVDLDGALTGETVNIDIIDEIVGKFLNSAKYELVRFPTKEEIDLFNSFDDLKILTGDASVNTVFKNLKTGNLVYHTMKRNKYNNYGYEYDLIYLSPNASKSILKEEDSKTVSDDDI